MANGITIEGWLDRKAAAAYLGMSDYWLEKHHASIDAPVYVQHGRKCWYRREVLDEWLSKRENIARTGAGGTSGRDALNALWGKPKHIAKPNVAEIERKYTTEHGPVKRNLDARRRKWAKLYETFSGAQRELYEEIRGLA